MKVNKIYCESNLETMAKMPDYFVDLVVTSPPYDNLRTYKGFDFDYKVVIKELYRITKQGGVVVWVVGDATIKGSETGTSFKQALHFMQCGFNLHDTMIYQKNGAAYPAGKNSNRYSNVFEYMFVFSKGRPKTKNLIKDKPNKWAGSSTFGEATNRQRDGSLKSSGKRTVGEFGYRDNIWRINNGKWFGCDNIALKHPAVFPEQLANDHIISWSNEGDIVYDPFMGSGTTAKMAILNKRDYIGSEISKEYCEIAEERIKNEAPPRNRKRSKKMKLCMDCKYCWVGTWRRALSASGDIYKCSHLNAHSGAYAGDLWASLVTCSDMRQQGCGNCGPKAVFFETRDARTST